MEICSLNIKVKTVCVIFQKWPIVVRIKTKATETATAGTRINLIVGTEVNPIMGTEINPIVGMEANPVKVMARSSLEGDKRVKNTKVERTRGLIKIIVVDLTREMQVHPIKDKLNNKGKIIKNLEASKFVGIIFTNNSEASQDDRIGPCKMTELVLLLLTLPNLTRIWSY